MAAKFPRGPSKGIPGRKFLAADGSSRRQRIVPLKSKNENEGPKLQNLLKEWGEGPSGTQPEETQGVPMEVWVQTAVCGRALTTKDCPLTSKHASLITGIVHFMTSM